MRTLRLASPLMRGADVKDAQVQLVRRGYLPKSSVDGVFGPVSANAAKDAKWDIGYAAKDATPTYGPLLHAYLEGRKKPTSLMRLRAKRRREQPPADTIGQKAAATMVSWYQAGWKEYPAGSNFVPQLSALAKDLGLASYFYSMRYPWCALGVFTAALKHQSKTAEAGLKRGAFNALYTPEIRVMAERGSFGMRAVSRSAIDRGVCVLFDFGGANGGEVDHIGIALGKPGKTVNAGGRRWTPGPGEVVCVEANTSYEGQPGSQADGGAVAIRIRDTGLIRTPFTIT